MAFYGVKPKIWPGKKPPTASGPDAYDPKSAGFAERNQKHTREMPGGLIREDIGEALP